MFQSKNNEEYKIPGFTSGVFFTEEISVPEARQKVIDYSEELNHSTPRSRRRRQFLLTEIQRLQRLVNVNELKQAELGQGFKPPGFW